MNALLQHRWGVSSAQDQVWCHVVGMRPSLAVQQLFMVLKFQAFIDDSYSKDEFVLAGHVAPAEAWAEFAKEWEELLPFGTLTKNGKQHFKMTEMGMTPERMARVPLFYKVIEKHVTFSVSVRLPLEDFERARDFVKAKFERLGMFPDFANWNNPFVLCYRALMDQFHKLRSDIEDKLPLDAEVDFIFDDQTEKRFLLAGWEEYLETRDESVRSLYGSQPRFEDDQKFLPLQAADLWAWWVRRWYEEDAIDYPDKMRTFDFGQWQGKKRPVMAMSFTEQSLVDALEGIAMESAAIAIADRKLLRGS